MSSTCPHPISIAPMMNYTDKHFRYLLRLITHHTLLYTEMITCDAILHGNRDRLLGYHPSEHPVALQLGGSDAEKLAACCRIAQAYGYDEINLNAGCPSDRVQKGKFGACLMKEPELLSDCLSAMREHVHIPVTLKTRIGVDELDSYEDLTRLISAIEVSGCHTIILHARKAWLKGLSPKQNRDVPPLQYETVYQLKQAFPQLNIVLNGGITTIAQMKTALKQVDGVMIGRQAYRDPYFLAEIDQTFYQSTQPPLTRLEVLARMMPYIREQLNQGAKLHALSRHLLHLFHNTANAKRWRRHISENAHKPNAGMNVLEVGKQLLCT